MLFVFGLVVILLVAFLAYLVAVYFIMKLMAVVVAGVAAALYLTIYLGLHSVYGEANVGAEILGSFAIGTAILAVASWAYRNEKAEKAKSWAADKAQADQVDAILRAEAAKAAKPDAWCPCGSHRPFKECHGSEASRAVNSEPIAETLKRTWTSLASMLTGKVQP